MKSLDSYMLVALRMPVDFVFLPVELSNPCGTRHSEGVVNLHYIVVEQVQFLYISLGEHIYKVRSGSTHANYCYHLFLNTRLYASCTIAVRVRIHVGEAS